MRKLVLITLSFLLTFSFFATYGDSAEHATEHIVKAETKSENPFSDLRTLGEEEIIRLFDNAIVTGFPDGTFRPSNNVTRAEAITMIGRALGLDGEQQPTQFPDVSQDHFASGYIAAGVKEGIITGFEDGTFKPSQPVTRMQMALFLTRAFELSGTSQVTFFDVTPYTDGYEEIMKLAEARITAGYPDNTYRPRNATSRLEFSLFLARTLFEEYRLPEQQFTDRKEISITRAVVVDAPGGLNVRTEPNASSQILGRLANGTMVEYSEAVGGWAKITYNDREAFVSMTFLRVPPVSSSGIQGRTIVIDPGHGGRDPGAVAFGVREKDVVLATGLILEKKLKDAGVNVIMTRSTDVFIELADRVAIAQNASADAFISLHVNAAGSNAAHGTETYWNRTNSSEESKELAEKIQKHLIQKLKTRDRGVKEANFHVIRNTQMPSVLVELGFVTNEAEAKRLATQKFHEDAAEAIFQGIVEFYR